MLKLDHLTPGLKKMWLECMSIDTPAFFEDRVHKRMATMLVQQGYAIGNAQSGYFRSLESEAALLAEAVKVKPPENQCDYCLAVDTVVKKKTGYSQCTACGQKQGYRIAAEALASSSASLPLQSGRNRWRSDGARMARRHLTLHEHDQWDKGDKD